MFRLQDRRISRSAPDLSKLAADLHFQNDGLAETGSLDRVRGIPPLPNWSSMARVLVVDDNEEERRLYARMLDFNGFDVLEAEDPIQGLEIAQYEQPDLILMDFRLPRLDGLVATKLLHSMPETAAIPVVCVTGLNVSPEQAKAAGCRELLAKPMGPQQLATTVRRWVNESADKSGRD